MIEVFTDGSSHACGGKPGGWSYIIISEGSVLTADYGGTASTTNNRMELTAAIMGLTEVSRRNIAKGQEVILCSDSQYTLGIASGEMNPTANIDLAKTLRGLAIELGVQTRWVRGHSGHPVNEECDRLAKKGKEEQIIIPKGVLQ